MHSIQRMFDGSKYSSYRHFTFDSLAVLRISQDRCGEARKASLLTQAASWTSVVSHRYAPQSPSLQWVTNQVRDCIHAALQSLLECQGLRSNLLAVLRQASGGTNKSSRTYRRPYVAEQGQFLTDQCDVGLQFIKCGLDVCQRLLLSINFHELLLSTWEFFGLVYDEVNKLVGSLYQSISPTRLTTSTARVIPETTSPMI